MPIRFTNEETAVDRYFQKRMEDPEFAKEYKKARYRLREAAGHWQFEHGKDGKLKSPFDWEILGLVLSFLISCVALVWGVYLTFWG